MAAMRIVALVGGIAERSARRTVGDAQLKTFASSRHGGVGEQRRLLESIRHGGIDEVWILTCWIGHSEGRAIVRACRKHGIAVRRFPGVGRLPEKV